MANVSTPNQFNAWENFLASLGMGDTGEGQYMTTPTALNTSTNWTPPVTANSTPITGANAGAGNGLGMNVATGQLALGGLSALSGIWGATQANKLAKDQFKFQKDVTNTNLNNQIQSYNTALEDRLTSRGAMEGRTADYTAAEIDRRRLSR